MNNAKIGSFGLAVVSILAAGATGCSGIQIATQKDPDADLAGLRTFEWIRPQPGGPANSIIDTQIEKSLKSNLAQLGVRPAAEGTRPDFLISYNTSVISIVSQSAMGGVGVGGRVSRHVGLGVSAPVGVRTDTTERSTLAISFIDPQRNEEVWHGTATADIDRSNQDVQNVQKAVGKMMREFEDARGKA